MNMSQIPTALKLPPVQIILLMISCLMISFGVPDATQAYDCFSPSPSYADGKSPFDPMTIRDLTPTEQDHLESLFKSLSGKWRGEAADVECKGSTNAPTINRNEYNITALVKVDRQGSIRIKTKLVSEENHSSHTEIMEFYLTRNKLRFENDSGSGDVQLIEVSEGEFKFLKRGIISGGRFGGPRKHEIILTLSARSDSFSIDTWFYIKGEFHTRRIRYFKR